MKDIKNKLNRRDYLKILGAGSVGSIFLGLGESCSGRTDGTTDTKRRISPPYTRLDKFSTVSLARGENRRDIVYQSMKNLEKDILQSIGNKKVLIKPNLVVTGFPTCATDPDAIRGVLDFLTPHIKDQIIVGESTSSRNVTTMQIFEEYGYGPLEKEYNVKLVDLNRESFTYCSIAGEKNTPVPIKVISDFLDPDTYVISVPRMKVHVHCYVTLALKNVLMAAPLNDYSNPEKGWETGCKYAMHVSSSSFPRELHYNMFLLAHNVYPDLAVIDGFEGMENSGPAGGDMVKSMVAVTSLDALSADVIATVTMGLDPKLAPYLNFLNDAGFGQGNIDKINIIGTPLSKCISKYRPDHNFMENLRSEKA